MVRWKWVLLHVSCITGHTGFNSVFHYPCLSYWLICFAHILWSLNICIISVINKICFCACSSIAFFLSACSTELYIFGGNATHSVSTKPEFPTIFHNSASTLMLLLIVRILTQGLRSNGKCDKYKILGTVKLFTTHHFRVSAGIFRAHALYNSVSITASIIWSETACIMISIWS